MTRHNPSGRFKLRTPIIPRRSRSRLEAREQCQGVVTLDGAQFAGGESSIVPQPLRRRVYAPPHGEIGPEQDVR